MEKTYQFKIVKDGRLVDGNHEIVLVKESELTKAQKELLLAECLKIYKDLPNDIKRKFIGKISANCDCGNELYINYHCSTCDNDE